MFTFFLLDKTLLLRQNNVRSDTYRRLRAHFASPRYERLSENS